MAWIVRLVSIGAEGEEHGTDVMRIARPDTLADLGTLGLSLAEGKRLLAGIQREIVAAQARVHAARRPECRGCGASCRVKDYRQPDGRRSIAPSRKLWTALQALDGYLVGQSDRLVNHGERHRAGQRVGTAVSEGTANSLVNRG